jgi:hypothetical protein
MKKSIVNKILLGLALITLKSSIGFAQDSMKTELHPVHKAYISSGIDGYILSSALLSKSGGTAKMTTPRFTAFLNIGTNLNYDFSSHIGAFTGLNIKNIGFIEKIGDVTIKRRDYTIGIPLGLKIGKINDGNYVLLGGGIDFPFNYREKSFTKRNDKKKFNEWFSNRTPAAMGYVFVGVHLRPGIALKLQYYPGNFLNPDYTETTMGIATKPYAGYKVNMMYLSLGFDIPYHPKEFKEKLKNKLNTKEI